jgi:uncharacterized protein (TIGR02453 family)
MVCKPKKSVSPAPVALPYFRPEALKFLRSLARHNDREWFQPRKAEYDAELKEPMLAIVRKVNEAMMDFAPEYIRPAEKSLFRIYRDTRFSPDKSPYKTHIAAWWPRAGCEKTSGAGFYFHVEAKEVILAAGAWMPEKSQLMQIRHWLLDNHVAFRKLLKNTALRKTFTEWEGKPLVRAPKGFDPEHPAMDLVRCRQWGLSTTLEPEAALDVKIADKVIRAFKLAAPVVNALNEPIVATQEPKKKVLFGLR